MSPITRRQLLLGTAATAAGAAASRAVALPGAKPRNISTRGASPGGVSTRVPHPASPDMYGSATPIAAAAATIASTAFPPAASMRTPASVASGLAVATIPRRP